MSGDAARGLLADDDVLPQLRRWRSAGQRAALVTLIGVEGGAPRQAGAQMAVAEDGRYAGYLSGGCIEAAVALEARAAMEARENRVVRYGEGSPYLDIRLPCGSGLDIYFDQRLASRHVDEMLALRALRRAFVLRTSLASGASAVEPIARAAPFPRSQRTSGEFKRVYPPPLHLLALGAGPLLGAIAAAAQVAGLDLAVWSPDEAARRQVDALGLEVRDGVAALDEAIGKLDAASAAVLVFHDHDSEPPILAKLLRAEGFYIGALGSRAVHRERLAALRSMGSAPATLSRLRAPIGSISGAKSKATLAIGVLAEILDEARSLNIVA